MLNNLDLDKLAELERLRLEEGGTAAQATGSDGKAGTTALTINRQYKFTGLA